MSIPAGLTCAACEQPFARALARRTPVGYVHARPCPVALTEGRWVTTRGIARWVA